MLFQTGLNRIASELRVASTLHTGPSHYFPHIFALIFTLAHVITLEQDETMLQVCSKLNTSVVRYFCGHILLKYYCLYCYPLIRLKLKTSVTNRLNTQTSQLLRKGDYKTGVSLLQMWKGIKPRWKSMKIEKSISLSP